MEHLVLTHGKPLIESDIDMAIESYLIVDRWQRTSRPEEFAGGFKHVWLYAIDNKRKSLALVLFAIKWLAAMQHDRRSNRFSRRSVP